MDEHFDCIIVGAGAAGCVLAGRLSADPAVRVLLIEAGADILPGEEPESIRDPFPSSYGDPRYSWPALHAEVGPDRGAGRGGFSRHYVQGRIMGGGSNIMGMAAQRGLPGDFDEWRDGGADGWGWNDVLPFYNRLENDHDFDGPLHGRDGPIVIRRHRREQWPPFAASVADALEQRGYRFFQDLNGDFDDGVCPMPMSSLPDRRVSSASGYLDAAVRRRPNLRVLAEAAAERILFDANRAVGLTVRRSGQLETYRAREVVLSAGAIFSPALLMRSGVGPAEPLRQLGIAPVADLPGVGANLQNHPAVHVAVHLPRHAVQPDAMRAWQQGMLRFSSGHEGCPPGDMYLFPTNRTSWHPLGDRIGAISTCVHKPFSRGSVRLRGADPARMPEVRFDLLKDARDFDRMAEGLRLTLSLLADPAVTPFINDVFHPDGGQANRLNRPSRLNYAKSWVIAVAFDALAGGRRLLLGKSLIDAAGLAADDAALRDTVRQVAAGVHHVCGTCKIGRRSDPAAVVDPECRVHGVTGLSVADASVMPTIVRATTHLTVLMIGEKAADHLQRRL